MNQPSTERPLPISSKPVLAAPVHVALDTDGVAPTTPASRAEALVSQILAGPVRNRFDLCFFLAQPTIVVSEVIASLQTMAEWFDADGDEALLRVHMQVQDPGAPLSYAVRIGQVTDVRVINLDRENLDGEILDGEVGAKTGVDLAHEPLPAAPTQPAPSAAVAFVAISAGEGFAAILRKLGADVVVETGESLMPAPMELAATLRALPNRRMLLLPNSADALVVAQQAADLVAAETPALTVLVAHTKTMPQLIAALRLCTSEPDDLAATVAQIHDRCAQIDTGVVTQAVCGAEFDGIAVEVGDFIGLHDGRPVTRSSDLKDVVLMLLEQMAADDSRTITMYYGDFISVEAAENLKESVRNRYADQVVALAYGGQAHDHYILSTE